MRPQNLPKQKWYKSNDILVFTWYLDVCIPQIKANMSEEEQNNIFRRKLLLFSSCFYFPWRNKWSPSNFVLVLVMLCTRQLVCLCCCFLNSCPYFNIDYYDNTVLTIYGYVNHMDIDSIYPTQT